MEHPAINTAWLNAWHPSLQNLGHDSVLHPTLATTRYDTENQQFEIFESTILVWQATVPPETAAVFSDTLATIQLLMHSKTFEVSLIPWFSNTARVITKYENRQVVLESGRIYLSINSSHVARADLTDTPIHTQRHAYLLSLAIFG